MSRYIVQKAPGVPGPPIPEDEPCIVIRGQDRLATAMLTTYISFYRRMDDADQQVIMELAEHYGRLLSWQENNPAKVKLADR